MKFVVNNQEWELKYVKPNSRNLMRSDGTITIGMTDNNTKTVYINNRLNEYMSEKVLAHEITHVFAFEYDYEMDIETEEIVADFISLYGKEIVYLLEDLERMLVKISS